MVEWIHTWNLVTWYSATFNDISVNDGSTTNGFKVLLGIQTKLYWHTPVKNLEHFACTHIRLCSLPRHTITMIPTTTNAHTNESNTDSNGDFCDYMGGCSLLLSLIGWILHRVLFTASYTLVFLNCPHDMDIINHRTCSASNICLPSEHGVRKAHLGTWLKIQQNFRDKSAPRLQNHLDHIPGSGRKIVFGGWNMMKPGAPDSWLLSRCTRFLLLQVVRKSPKPNRVAEWNHLFLNKNKHKSMCMYYVCISYQHIIENTQIQEVICLAPCLGLEYWQFSIFPFKTNMIWSLIIASTQVSSKPLTIRTTHDYMISFSFLDLCSFKSQHERNARQICKYWLITIANLQHRS